MTIFDSLIEQWGGATTVLSALGSQRLHGRLAVDTVQSLITWADLDELLSRGMISTKVRVVNDGKVLKASCYLDDSSSVRRTRHPSIVADKLCERLSRGASLVIDDVDEQLPRIRETALDLADVVGEHVQAHAYATWGNSHAFDAHWDPLDVLVVQVHGEKHWDVYGPGTPTPLDPKTDPDNTCPAHPEWSGTLRPGDVLYIPRGWWHAVRGIGTPSLHVSYGFQRRTGVLYLAWLMRHVAQAAALRTDLPRVGGAEALAQHHKAVADCVAQLMQDHPLQEYLDEFAATVARPTEISLAAVR